MIDLTTLSKVDCVLVGQNGNAFNILGLFANAAHKAKWPPDKIDAVVTDAMSGDYNHLLATVLKYCKNPMGEKDSEDEHEEDDDDSDDTDDEFDDDDSDDEYDDDNDDDEPEDGR